ncbi:MAG: hypothetical protein GC179_21730 [Anaerolineaceae bacterium]|nr:hypothetical protein [Anaerolineaceae bacterium]
MSKFNRGLMKYYKYPNPEITDEEIATDYIEVDGNLALRQLSVLEQYDISSNVDLLLMDQPFEYEEEIIAYSDTDDFVPIPIEADEFNAVWERHLQRNEVRWNTAKKSFPINTPVVGCIAIFFPQGVIVELGERIFGVTDYVQARASASADFIMRTGRQISGIVTGYDETNQWIHLGSPQIHADKNCDPQIWRLPS